MGSKTRRFAIALAAAGLLVTVSCSKDETVTSTSTSTPVTASSGGGTSTTETTEKDDSDKESGDYEEVCAKLEELDNLGDDVPDDEAFALMEEARDVSPAELEEHWDVLIDILGELVALGDDDEAMVRAFEIMEDPEFLEAAATIDDFAEEECGLDIDLDPAEEPNGGLVEDPDIDTTDTTDPDADPTSIDSVQAHIEKRFGTEDWYSVLDENVTWGSSGTDEVTWTIGFGDDPTTAGMTMSDLNDVCEVMATYLDTYESGEVTIEISGPDEALIMTRAPGGSCEEA